MTATNISPVTMKELNDVTDDLTGLMVCIPSASDQLGLDMRQIGIFCRNTPGGKKGEALWIEFTTRRDKQPKGEYDFKNFMKEVLTEAGHPID
jgi:hypothetical protein